MRIRVLANARVYWDYAVHELHEGAEHVGEFARHLAHTGAPVEVIERDPEPAPPSPAVEATGQDPAPLAQTLPDGALTVPEGLEIDGTIDTVLGWVGSDLARARQALDLEMAKGDRARATLTGRLDALLQGAE
ncbi:hypothetical protein [Kitasatospora sp. NPDC001175]|uniref:hypothetical protein n=1 Tax=Kitasatospora sp. NPDC001175 TaxID=3157103 RepID=UPI003CFCCE5E